MNSQYELHAIVPHTSEARVLLLQQDTRWSLVPIAAGEGYHGAFGQFDYGMTLRSVLGLAVNTLRCAAMEKSPEGDSARMVFVMENLDAAWQPSNGARWVNRQEVEQMELADAGHKALLLAWFDEPAEGSTPSNRVPWAQPGWHRVVQRWIDAQLEALGRRSAGAHTQERNWSQSCVLRVPTDGDTLYFKAVPPMLAREGKIIQALSAHYAEHVPDVLASDSEQGWLLMRDFGGTPLGELPDLGKWRAALLRYAEIQRQLAAQPDDLLKLGCPDYRLSSIFDKFEALLGDKEVTLLGQPGGLTAEEVERLRAQIPQLKALVAQLESYQIPASLVHCDFHPWNIQVNEECIIYFDWADGCLAHPFFDLLRFLPLVERDFPDQPEAVDQLREAYLDLWTQYEPTARLNEAYALAERLSNVQQAVYYGDLVAGIEASARWELEEWPVRFLKALL